jgi:hypothetical protein
VHVYVCVCVCVCVCANFSAPEGRQILISMVHIYTYIYIHIYIHIYSICHAYLSSARVGEDVEHQLGVLVARRHEALCSTQTWRASLVAVTVRNCDQKKKSSLKNDLS